MVQNKPINLIGLMVYNSIQSKVTQVANIPLLGTYLNSSLLEKELLPRRTYCTFLLKCTKLFENCFRVVFKFKYIQNILQ